MKIIEIIPLPTSVEGNFPNGVHESIFKSFHILEKVKKLLEYQTPYPVILELITEMETDSSSFPFNPQKA